MVLPQGPSTNTVSPARSPPRSPKKHCARKDPSKNGVLYKIDKSISAALSPPPPGRAPGPPLTQRTDPQTHPTSFGRIAAPPQTPKTQKQKADKKTNVNAKQNKQTISAPSLDLRPVMILLPQGPAHLCEIIISQFR